MRGSLSVRINDGYRSRNVTASVAGLKFRKTAPGGHHSASMQITLPHDAFTDLGPADKVFIYDARTAGTVWEGYTEDPGVTDGPVGQSYDLSAMGGVVLLADESQQLLYIDRDLAWEKYTLSAASATADQGADPAGVDSRPGLHMGFNPGQPVGTNGQANMGYNRAREAGVQIGAVRVTVKSGKIDAGYANQLAARGGASSDIAIGSGISTTATSGVYFVGTHLPLGTNAVALNLIRTGAPTNVADDNTWSWYTDVAVAVRRMDRYGTLAADAAAMATSEYVRADWVVEDLLGRALPMLDPATAVVDATTAQIDQLAYPDGATARQVLDDLGLWEPDYVWEVLESNTIGLHRFNYRAWPATPRYEISTRDGYSAPGGEVDLCNRVSVYWTDAQGRSQSTIVTSVVEALGGRTRDAEPITLPAGLGSAANAARIGAQVLASKSGRARAASAKVRRPIIDHLTHSTVMPWEIEPGYMVRVRETGEDLRLTEMEYDDDECATTLTLGEPVLSTEQRVARLWATTRKAA